MNTPPCGCRGQTTLEYLVVLSVILIGLLIGTMGPLRQSVMSAFGGNAATLQSSSQQMTQAINPWAGEREQHPPLPVPAQPGQPAAVAGGWQDVLPDDDHEPRSGGGGGGSGGGGGVGGGSQGDDSDSDTPRKGLGGHATASGPIGEYVHRGHDIWTGWPDVNRQNIIGDQGQELLRQTFDQVANSSAKFITDDLYRKGVPISFDNAAFQPGGACVGAIACFVADMSAGGPQTPSFIPHLYFNPNYLADTPEALAPVLIHEGTHLGQYLDGTLSDSSQSTVDLEFPAFWNQSVYWAEAREGLLPMNSRLELQLEAWYQAAAQGEATLRNMIDSVYPN